MPFALSKVFGPMYVHRYTIAAAPAFYLLLALGINAARKAVPLPASLGLIAILIAPGLFDYFVSDVKEQWREAAAYVEANAEASEVIVFAPGENGALRRTFNWYYGAGLPQCDLPTTPADEEAIVVSLTQCTAAAERYWLILRGMPERLQPFASYFLSRPQASGGLRRGRPSPTSRSTYVPPVGADLRSRYSQVGLFERICRELERKPAACENGRRTVGQM